MQTEGQPLVVACAADTAYAMTLAVMLASSAHPEAGRGLTVPAIGVGLSISRARHGHDPAGLANAAGLF